MPACLLDTVRAYLDYLRAGDTAALIACFEADGEVHSPFLGRMQAADFFPRLAEASQRSVITLIDLFTSVGPADDITRVAAYFRYDWTLSDGIVIDFTCVDVFEFKSDRPLISTMRIVYDTHPLREQVGDKYAPRPAAAQG